MNTKYYLLILFLQIFNTNCNENCLQEQQLPNAIIIGVKKSGTYALLRYLNENSRIKSALKLNGCPRNEIHYFDNDDNYAKGLKWYQKQMPFVCLKNQNQTIVIEKTPGYFSIEAAARRIRDFNPNIKIIAIVREPITRLQSELTQCHLKKANSARKKFKCKNFDEIFQKKNWSDVKMLKNRFIGNSVYYLQLKRWYQIFNSSQILIVNAESFRKEPWTDLNKVERFLNIDEEINRETFRFDEKKKFYCLNEPQGCLGDNKGRKHVVELSQKSRDRLKKFFQKWNQKLFELIGQQFDW